MTQQAHQQLFSLAEIAQQAMIERGLIPEFPQDALSELESIQTPATPMPNSMLRDLRELLWVSIDNDDSKDLDQITYAKEDPSGKVRVFVAVSDVDAIVKKNSKIDQYASHNTTSVYTPTRIFPMLPLKLSTDLTSLNENQDRCAIVTEMLVDQTGLFELVAIYPAWVKNHAKLTYNGVSQWLDNQTEFPLKQATEIPALSEQLKLQDSFAQKIKAYRYREGTLNFGVIEVTPVVVEGLPVDLKEIVHNRALELIENFMIAANVCMARFLEERKKPMIKRVVKTPKRWDRIVELAQSAGFALPDEPNVKALRDFLADQKAKEPDQFHDLSVSIIKLIGRGEYVVMFPGKPSPGHFDLGQDLYAHTTAPNRRFPDLIEQRIIKHCFYGGKFPYSDEELTRLADNCTEKEAAADKVERRVRKSAEAIVMSKELGHLFKAIVTGVSESGTFVRLFEPLVEGKLVKGFKSLDVGDRLNVKLVHVDVFNGYIDFANVE